MTSARVVPALDVGEQRQPSLGLGLPTAPVAQLAFKRGDEALGHRVLVGPELHVMQRLERP